MGKILIIGAGVSGLTSGLVLARAGHDVSIWAKDLPENTTSAIAAAFWYPYLSQPHDKVIKWSKFTREYLEDTIADDPTAGVRPVKMIEYFDQPQGDPWWAPAVKQFAHVDPNDLPDGYKDGFWSELVLIDTSRYLPWLVSALEELNVTITKKVVVSFGEIPQEFDVIVNCSGLGARELCNDERVFPTRGQVVKIKHNGMEEVLSDDTSHNNLAYIIPRYDDIVLGGTAQPNDWRLEVDDNDTEEILHKASLLDARFEQVDILTVKVGLRPSRDEVRLEYEDINGKKVIHNYGHGGSGYTLSWGCAEEVLSLVKGIQ